jgi:hypothetical protein
MCGEATLYLRQINYTPSIFSLLVLHVYLGNIINSIYIIGFQFTSATWKLYDASYSLHTGLQSNYIF